MDFKRNILPLKNIVFRTALRITMNREEAEDIVQDTMLKLWERFCSNQDKIGLQDTAGQPRNIEAFAVTMARNLALDRIGKGANNELTLDINLHDRPDEWQSSPEDIMAHNDNDSIIEQIMNRLPEKQRTVLHLRDVEAKSYKEIAEILSLSESDVKVTLFRARTALKESYMRIMKAESQ